MPTVESASARATDAAPLPPEPRPEPPKHSSRIERVDVPGDKWALVSQGEPSGRDVLVYLHGKCGDPEAFHAFLEAVPPEMTVVSMRGEIKCEDGARTRWAGNVQLLDARIAKAVSAVSAMREVPLRTEGWVVLGYSQGSLRAESLISKLPRRYAGAILAAGPRAPRDHALDAAGPVVLLAGALDVRGHLMKAAAELAERGRPVVYRELPEAHHGEYGPRAIDVLRGCFEWMKEQPSFRDEGVGFQN